MRLLTSGFLSIYALYTSLNLYGPGTCSFDGAAGGRIVYIERFYDNSGAISCNLAASLIAFLVIAYWLYVYSEFKGFKEINNSNFQKEQDAEFYNESQNLNSEVYELEKKLEEISEEEKLRDLREQLNKKRLERNLISLEEYEQLEENIITLRNNFKILKNRYQKQVENINKIKSDKYIYSTVLLFLSGLLLRWTFSGLESTFWFSFGLFSFILNFSLGIWNFKYRNKLIRESTLILENLEMEKQDNLTNLKQAKKFLNENNL